MLRSQQKYSKINKIQNQLKHNRQPNSPYQKNIYKRNYSQPKIKVNYFQKLIQNVPNDQIIIQHYIEKLKQLKKKVKTQRKKSQRLQSKQDIIGGQGYSHRKFTQPSALLQKIQASRQNNIQHKDIQEQKKQERGIKQMISQSKKKLKNDPLNLITFEIFRNKVKQQKKKSAQKKQILNQQDQDVSLDQIYEFKQKYKNKSPQQKIFIRDKRKHSSKLKIIQSDFRKLDNPIQKNTDQKKQFQNNKKLKIDRYQTEKGQFSSQQKQKSLRAQNDVLDFETKNNVIIQKIFNIQQNINVFKKQPYLCRKRQNNRPKHIMKSMQLRRPHFSQKQKNIQNDQALKNKTTKQYSKPYQIFKSMQIKRKIKQFDPEFYKNNEQNNNNISQSNLNSQTKQKKKYNKSLSKLNKLSENQKKYYQNEQNLQNLKQSKQISSKKNSQAQMEQIKKKEQIKNYLKSIEEFSTIQMKKQTLQFLGESCINIKHELIESQKKMNKILDLLGLRTDQLNQALTNQKKRKKTQYQKFNKIFPQGFFE